MHKSDPEINSGRRTYERQEFNPCPLCCKKKITFLEEASGAFAFSAKDARL